METKRNFLLGNGDNLTKLFPFIKGGGSKVHPYTFAEAKERLIPKVGNTVAAIESLPRNACPSDKAVAVIALHPAYLAKSYYPSRMLGEFGLRCVGSRGKVIRPEKTVPSLGDGQLPTVELFVAGKRRDFAGMAKTISMLSAHDKLADEIVRLEDFRSFVPGERLKKVVSFSEVPLMEVVLHADPRAADVIRGFRDYLEYLGVHVDLSVTYQVKNLCFIPVQVPRAKLGEVEKFSFLRVAREMPALRLGNPTPEGLMRSVYKHGGLAVARSPLDPNLRIAVFDGGLPKTHDLSKWATLRECPGLGKPSENCEGHGLGVTSAFLFGSIRENDILDVPFAHVDHYRVVDEHTNPVTDSYNVLDRILNVLRQNRYDLMNLSIGPSLPIDDQDIDRWTAELDTYLADGTVLATIAAGNGGERDSLLGYNRIQIPADCVNALAVGACDSDKQPWRRAPYSSVGPGRSPGIVKPDLMAFGGSRTNPFWVLDAKQQAITSAYYGTSFAAPLVLRQAAAIRAQYGRTLSALLIRALLIHHADPGEHPRYEVGWGRIAESLEHVILCPRGTVKVVYQGELTPRRYLRAPIPLPSGNLNGKIRISATFCFASDTDPEHMPNYTRSGLEIVFRPHDEMFAEKDSQYPKTAEFFQKESRHVPEIELRRDGWKWETVLNASRTKQAKSLKNPSFDIHYNIREEGQSTSSSQKIPYALVVSIEAPKVPDIYDRVVNRYRGRLEPMKPVIEIPVRV